MCQTATYCQTETRSWFKFINFYETLKELITTELRVNTFSSITHPYMHIAEFQITAYGNASLSRKLQCIINIMAKYLHQSVTVGIRFQSFRMFIYF